MNNVNPGIRWYRYTYDLVGKVETRVKGLLYADSDERAKTFLKAQIARETRENDAGIVQQVYCTAQELIRDDDVKISESSIDSGFNVYRTI